MKFYSMEDIILQDKFMTLLSLHMSTAVYKRTHYEANVAMIAVWLMQVFYPVSMSFVDVNQKLLAWLK